jgi:hypothetical protein
MVSDVSFEIGQLVLALLPVPGKSVAAKYQGPFKILDQPGPVDYVTETLIFQ